MSGSSSFSVVVRDVSVWRADRPVLVDIDLTFSEQTRTALVGPNGVGKSTLLRVIAGHLSPDSGSVTTAPPTIGIGLLGQELDRTTAPSVRLLIAAKTGVTAAEIELERATDALATTADSSASANTADQASAADGYERALNRLLSIGAADFDARLETVADDLGLDQLVLDRHPSVLSGGEAERVGLAAVMLSRFDLTLLDEPTNNLDLTGLELLERWAAERQGGLVIVSHDRAFLERTIDSVVEIDEHHHTAAQFQGGWEAFLIERSRTRALAEERHANYTEERDRLAGRAQQQREWVARGVSRARKSPADGDKHRRNFQMAQTERLAAKSKATIRAMARLEEVEKPWQPWDLRFRVAEAPRSATVVTALDAAVLQRGQFAIGPLNLEIRWAERVAIVGPNGCGKSTVLAAMLGHLEPVAGQAMLGSGVVVGELDQGRHGLFAGTEGVLGTFQHQSALPIDEARSILAKFGIDAEAVARPAESLSPGQRTRVQLALFQARGVNLLVLDEPTNHLDLPAIEQLEAALAEYDGTMLLVSHDRRFLEAIELTRTIDLTAEAPSTQTAP